MDNNLDILLRFILDQSAKANTVAGIEAMERAFENFRKEMDGAKKDARELKSLANELGQTFRNSFLVGTAITGGIFAAANSYVKNAKEATAVTIAWKAAQDGLGRSNQRIGAVLAQEALPLLQTAARLANQAAGIVEKHPEIVRAALNAGLVIAGLSAVGIAVTKGIRLIADAKYLAAVVQEQIGINTFSKAVDRFLIGTAQFSGKNPDLPTPSNNGTGRFLSNLGLIGVFLATSTTIVLTARKAFNDLGDKLIELGGVAEGVGTGMKIATEGLRQFLNQATALPSVGTRGGRSVTTAAIRSPGISPEALQAYEQYRQDDLAAVQQHYQERNDIIRSALAAEQKANADYAASVSRVRSQTTSALADAARAFNEANRRAEIENAQERARIIRDGGQEIQQIEQDLQEQLRRNAMEHAQRTADLTADRDALGLVKETRRFQEQQDEARREANLEIRQRRADIAQRLADLQQSFEQERAQRFADYQARVAEIRANAAQQLAELRSQHLAEIREIRLQKIARIRELDAEFQAERNRRNQQFIQTLRDIDAGLLGEKRLREQYYASMEQDLRKFLTAYKSGLATLFQDIPGRASGGYTSGLVRTGEAGYEYVLSHNTTRAAEAVIGGQLTQQGLLNALSSGGRNINVQVSDTRRFDRMPSSWERERMNREMVNTLEGLLS